MSLLWDLKSDIPGQHLVTLGLLDPEPWRLSLTRQIVLAFCMFALVKEATFIVSIGSSLHGHLVIERTSRVILLILHTQLTLVLRIGPLYHHLLR